ncbi:hypothetical protein GALMADRAFT_136308 [Galerina marginata CBS 339.88]|uniref:Uncharacterized protein n=1 Tax=Galerina marginata (strain CBS 339.88) TaxID=685588 RepID=A0A067TQN2_GALM3|nr:hypothetical protein GALMADRAFT_136308 [Galerina marginata CBS 339.88]
MTPTRWIMVDSTDPYLQYSPNWVPATATTDNLGHFGSPFSSTLQQVNYSGASVRYTFSGTQVRVYGTGEKGANGVDPSWSCSVDRSGAGIITTNNMTDLPKNNWVLCEAHSLPDGLHTVSLSVLDPGSMFWLNRFDYVPSNGVPVDNARIFVQSSDPIIQYGSGWTSHGDTGRITQDSGSNMMFDFVGVRLLWLVLEATAYKK